jgi:hypothetical protein
MGIATDITLDPKYHIYRDTKGREYTSVSSLIKMYQAPFPADKIAEAIARRDGKTPEAVKAEWKAASDYGTHIHLGIERFFRGLPYTKDIDFVIPTLKAWVKHGQENGYEFLPETILCLPDIGLAGTADLPIKKKGCYSIIDWKTNKSIDDSKKRKLKGNLSHLYDNKLTTYSLQQSIYAVMLEAPIDKLCLAHLHPKEDGTRGEKIIPCQFYEEEARLMIDEFRRGCTPEHLAHEQTLPFPVLP